MLSTLSLLWLCLLHGCLRGCLRGCLALRSNLQFSVGASKVVCFYDDFDSTSPVKTVEVFLLQGGVDGLMLNIHGPLSLNEMFDISNYGNPLVADKIDVSKEIGSDTLTFSLDFKPKATGTYAFCFDNKKSRFETKKISLDIRNAHTDDPVPLALTKNEEGKLNEEEGYSAVKESIERIKKGIITIQKQQQWDRNRLSLHSETNHASHIKVVIGSIVETAFFIIVSIFQIYFVRRWFTSKPTSGTKGTKHWA